MMLMAASIVWQRTDATSLLRLGIGKRDIEIIPT
jgi:hypothetical protein